MINKIFIFTKISFILKYILIVVNQIKYKNPDINEFFPKFFGNPWKSKALSPLFIATFTELWYTITPVLSILILFFVFTIVSINDGRFNLNELIRLNKYQLNSSFGSPFGSIGNKTLGSEGSLYNKLLFVLIINLYSLLAFHLYLNDYLHLLLFHHLLLLHFDIYNR